MNNILERVKMELDYMIIQETNPYMQKCMKKTFADVIEARGYYKGLKVAKKCLEKHIALGDYVEKWEVEVHE